MSSLAHTPSDRAGCVTVGFLKRRRTLLYGALIVLSTLAGATLRFAPLGLGPFLVKYGGSTMWALTIYWVLALGLRCWSVGQVALLAGGVAAAVEALKLYRVPWLDAFRGTLPGILLLGRYFAWWDIVAYWIAIASGAVVDRRWIRKAGTSPFEGEKEGAL